MERDEAEWLSLLRALDEPGEMGQAAGLYYPRVFDREAVHRRFERLAARLSNAFGCPLTAGGGPEQDAAYFGRISIPPEFTKTRAKRSHVRHQVDVVVSNFGNLATYRAAVPVHPDDRRRIEQVLGELGYLAVPTEVLDLRYDGPNRWVFGGSHSLDPWYVRFFDYL